MTPALDGPEHPAAPAVGLAVVASLTSLISMLALCGFLANAVVHRSVDVGPATTTAFALAIDLALVGLFGLQHSLMARASFKRWTSRAVTQSCERSTYALAASFTVLLLITQWQPITTRVWNVAAPSARIALWSAFAAGWLVMTTSAIALDALSLSGLRQAFAHARGVECPSVPFRVSGLHRLVRHPTYLGWFLAVWSTPSMSTGHALLAATTSIYVLVAIRLEERDLLREHGALYERYRLEVPMLVPWRGLAPATQGFQRAPAATPSIAVRSVHRSGGPTEP